MAARTRKVKHDDFTRAKIRVSQLINVLENHALSGGEFEPTRVRAIEILLRKALPDLSNVNHTEEGSGGDTVEWLD